GAGSSSRASGSAMVFEQQVVDHRHRKKDRRTMLCKDPPDDVWRWLFTTENRRRSVQEWKRKAVTQTVSEGQSRRREQSIVGPNAQHFATVSFVRVEDVGRGVNGA